MSDIMTNPIQNFNDFLSRHEVKTGSNYTNLNPKRSYFVEDGKDYKKFIHLYTQALLTGCLPYHITQKHKIISYFIVDIDFKFPKQFGKFRIYIYDDIVKLVALCNRKLQKYLKIKKSQLKAFVMEKAHPHVRKDYSCDGLHIVYPYVAFHTNAHYLVINDMIEEAIRDGFFARMPCRTPVDKMFDTGVIYQTNWMLYGCCKPDGSPYYLTHVFKADLEELSLSDYKMGTLPELLNIRKYDEPNVEYITGLTQEKVDTMLNEMKNAGKNKKTKEQHINKNQSQKDKLIDYYDKMPSIHIVAKSTYENIVRAQRLMKLISPERANNYKQWIDIGIALHNIDFTLLHTWINFSKSCGTKYKPGECEKLWGKFGKYGYAMGTLCMWAKQDNPEDFDQFKRNEIKESLRTGLSCTTFDVAKVVYDLHKHEYVCASIKYKEWFHFSKHRWNIIDDGYSLKNTLSTILAEEYSKLASQLYALSFSADNKTEKDRLSDEGKRAGIVVTKLKDITFKNKVMEECRLLFMNDGFYDKLDENRNLLGFDNGVYDLDKGEFREGTPDDFITLSTKIKYMPYDANDPKIKWCKNFLRQIQPNPAMRKYVKRLLASFLQGHNPDEKFHFFSGTGCFLLNTLIMMYTGKFQCIQNIKVGDKIMGYDSKPRTVTSLIRNYGMMYKITPIWNGVELPPYVVNDEHILVLRAVNTIIKKKSKVIWFEWKGKVPVKKEGTCSSENAIRKGEKLLIKLKDWNKLLSSCALLSTVFMGYRTAIEMKNKNLTVNPYVLGVWIRFGSPHQRRLTNISKKLTRSLIEEDVIRKNGKFTKDVYNMLDELGMFNSLKQKRIPEHYCCSSLKTRKELIVGLEESKLVFSNEDLANDVTRLYNSVGKIAICENVKNQLSKWKVTVYQGKLDTKLDIRPVGHNNYYGFSLKESDKRFVLNDCSVVHNSNGKSKLIALLQLGMGDYADQLPVSLLTKPRGASSSASPELAKTKGKRFCVMQEPEQHDVIYEGLMKELTGGDKIQARHLYKAPIEFMPQFKLVQTCNRLPTINATDQGTWRRVRLVEFKSEFVDHPDPEKKHQFKIDKKLNDKLPLYAEAFMSLLINEFGKYKKEGLIEPEEVTKFTNQYRIKSDVFLEFIQSNYIKTNNEDDTLELKSVYNLYRSWYRETQLKKSEVGKKDLIEYLIKHDYQIDDDTWFGYALKTKQNMDKNKEMKQDKNMLDK